MNEDKDISELMQKAKESLEAAKSLYRDGFYGFSAERLQVAAADSTFDFLKAPEEDTYTLADGRSFHDRREFMSQESGYQISTTRKI